MNSNDLTAGMYAYGQEQARELHTEYDALTLPERWEIVEV